MDQDRVSGAMNSMAGKVEGAAGDLTGDAKLKAQGSFDDAVGQAQSGIGRARDNLRGTVESLSQQASSAASDVRSKMGSAGDSLEATVRENPLAALLSAASVGYLLAFLIHRR